MYLFTKLDEFEKNSNIKNKINQERIINVLFLLRKLGLKNVENCLFSFLESDKIFIDSFDKFSFLFENILYHQFINTVIDKVKPSYIHSYFTIAFNKALNEATNNNYEIIKVSRLSFFLLNKDTFDLFELNRRISVIEQTEEVIKRKSIETNNKWIQLYFLFQDKKLNLFSFKSKYFYDPKTQKELKLSDD